MAAGVMHIAPISSVRDRFYSVRTERLRPDDDDCGFASRDFDGVSESDRRIRDSKAIDDLEEIALHGKPGKKHARTFYCAELCPSLFKSFRERDRALLMNFHKRGASPMPEKGAVLLSQTSTG